MYIGIKLEFYAWDLSKGHPWKNLQIMEQTDADVILTDCGSCTSFLHEYPEILQDEIKQEKARSLVGRIKDVTTWYEETKELANYTGSGAAETVTYHDPCHLAHYLNVRQAPRQILQSIPGLNFTELKEADMCCGGAGSYNIAHPEISGQILQRKMDNIDASGASVLATSCPACVMQLAYGVRERKWPIQVKHISQIVNENTKYTGD